MTEPEKARWQQGVEKSTLYKDGGFVIVSFKRPTIMVG